MPNVPKYRPSNPKRSAVYPTPQRFNYNAGRNRPKFRVAVTKNPIKDGNVMLCDICGAFTHLQARCPHNPNNKIFVADAEDWEDGKYIVTDGDKIQQEEIYNQNDHAENIANTIGESKDHQEFYAVHETLTVTEVFTSEGEPIKRFGLKDEIGTAVLDTWCI